MALFPKLDTIRVNGEIVILGRLRALRMLTERRRMSHIQEFLCGLVVWISGRRWNMRATDKRP